MWAVWQLLGQPKLKALPLRPRQTDSASELPELVLALVKRAPFVPAGSVRTTSKRE